ncbi:hypothetical protein CPB84DRAFT_1764089 [Gymnopilus junonius]|uniref:DUF7918 domain-containing protein n=1 Tax=Gymnopilus junonius TaxID=109634 RepID=A0A9P5TTD4_GYMJU|nr:hypothetical protein CPB84DRAFT_1764089 [Gymnopilus junonius]
MSTKLLSFKGHDIWITVDGKEVEHYGVTSDESTNSVQCWIPSENDKPFAICVRNDPIEIDCALKIFLDGHACASFLFQKGLKWERTISYSTISATEVRDFIFGSLDSTDDDAYLEGSTLQSLGEIRAEIYKATVLEVESTGAFYSIPEVGKVHERSKKAVNHQVKFSQSRQLEKPISRSRVNYLEKLATFTFLYRPLAVLQATDIAPYKRMLLSVREDSSQPTPPPQPTQKRKHSDMRRRKNEEVVLLERLSNFQESFQTEMEKLRSEINQVRARKADKRSKKKVKQEPKACFVPGEVIDLT